MYPPVTTTDGKPMNAMHDYVIRMSKDELPPAKAFWSLTLYDSENGFFILSECDEDIFSDVRADMRKPSY